jgi:hypothetical protein
METVTITINKSCGYSGKLSAKTYIAAIVGTSKQYIFNREFVQTEATDAAEMFKARRKGKGCWTEAAAVEAGLYEVQDGEGCFKIVQRFACSEDRALKMALLMDQGCTFEEARLQTRAPAAPAAPATN